ncbi:hypothetical protein I316_06356 [Kwoniella heveanensis BCC8398]|uniref:UBC core domain-containing protein n=1 Tax=Kwoniella heveanensis BCC8398 TaxID=1296120 RepID=A0A1B9GLW9_9TREE|nr:hypothetical protein I316_06356 [Kwoniella heveanensis BCC8398]
MPEPEPEVIIVYDSDSEGDFGMDDEIQAAVAASLLDDGPAKKRVRTDSPVPKGYGTGVSFGSEGWKSDFELAKKKWGSGGTLEGYAGMEGTIDSLSLGDADQSISLKLGYEDIDGKENKLQLEMYFQSLNTYPASYKVICCSPSKLPKRASTTFSRFENIYDLDIPSLFQKILSSLQGDDEADGGTAPGLADGIEGDADTDTELDGADPWADGSGSLGPTPGTAFERPFDRDLLRQHFLQAKKRGYRPGFTQVSDFWVISYSIPLKNLPIDPNVLGMWDDGLVEAWKNDKRLVLLMGVNSYPPQLDQMGYWCCFHSDYKPSLEETVAITRDHGASSFYLAAPLLNYLKSFSKCYKLRTSLALDWATSDQIGMDDEMTRRVFHEGQVPEPVAGVLAKHDPVEQGLSDNIPLCAFWWTLRRFVNAPNYCLNCGLQVSLPSLRPYVCDKALCLYGFMSLGLGPSVEHTIITHPSVVDILLSFAHSAASGRTRMELPLHLHIEVPAEFTHSETKLIDTLSEPDGRRALVWLIDQLPSVSDIRTHLLKGNKLKLIDVPSGSIGVLRWVVGSCRAYLKEAKPGEGVQHVNGDKETADNAAPAGSALNWSYYHGGMPSGEIKQFTFVVGSPEQENSFRREIELAQARNKNCKKYPTLMAFHGSHAERWHNILRKGLDFTDQANGRAYGNGVYFASDSATSMGSYATQNMTPRDNADFKVIKAAALVELVNVPDTFVSSNPYYVVNNTKQIKPFLLLVQGTTPLAAEESSKSDEPKADGPLAQSQRQASASTAITSQGPLSSLMTTLGVGKAKNGKKSITSNEKEGELFKHDPSLKLKPKWYYMPLEVRMPEKLTRTTFVDDDPDDPADQAIVNHPPSRQQSSNVFNGSSAGKTNMQPNKKILPAFVPSPQARFDRIELLPPPSENSVVASKTLAKEWKALLKTQEAGELPFYVNPDSDNLYCWLLELHTFPPDSHLFSQMKSHKLNSIIAELRFPATFPHSPPFMRILHPRMLPFTSGGGGNITGGGSVCNELMTGTGWNPAFNVESVVREVMTNMTEATPPAKLDPGLWDRPYSMREAIDAFKRVAKAHGWQIPKDFDKLSV